MRSEARLLGVADVVLASSAGVRDHLVRLGRADVRLWENVADVELFRSARPPRVRRAIFAGNLTPEKVDLELLTARRIVVLAGAVYAGAVIESVRSARAGTGLDGSIEWAFAGAGGIGEHLSRAKVIAAGGSIEAVVR